MKNFNEKYTVRDFIDKNKWSNVYECINNETNEKIILNIITSLDKSEEHMSYFKEEINTLMSMNNSNLISINDMSSYINKDKTYYYIESECFEGLNLKELKESTDLDEIKSLEIAREVIKGIKEFNDRQINYGILKEENIIINKDGIVKSNRVPDSKVLSCRHERLFEPGTLISYYLFSPRIYCFRKS